jgi:hypothetical protein
MTKLAVLAIFAEAKGFATPDHVRQKLQPSPDRRSFYSYLARLQQQGLLERAPVLFQDVVHSIGTREADCDEQSSFRGQIEWTSTRMPDSLCAVERLWSKPGMAA